MKYIFNSKTIIIFGVITLFAVVFSLTYAITLERQTTTIGGSILKVDEEVYENLEINSNNFMLKPILDKDVNHNNENVIKLNFKVGGAKENNAKNIIYNISLTELNLDCDLLSPYLKWRLVKNNEIISEGSFDYKFDTIINNRLVLTNVYQDLKPYSEDKSTYDDYMFYMWLSDSCQEDEFNNCINSDNQTNLIDKKITGRISVELIVGIKEELIRNPSEILNTENCINEMEVEN